MNWAEHDIISCEIPSAESNAMFNRLSHLSFRTRSPDRDSETDRLRRNRLVNAIDDVVSEILSERRGLKARYDEACVSAGFALDDGAQSETHGRQALLSDLSTTVMACERRLTILSRDLEKLAVAKAAIADVDEGVAKQPPEKTM